MGNKQVKVALRVDEKNYVAGGVVTGRVYLSIGQEYQADALNLVLVGEENTTIAHDEENHHHHSSRYSATNREIERSSTTLVHMDVPLTHFPAATVSKGQYEYPFEWELPSNLKGSMFCGKGDSHCEIRYNLTAYLQKSGVLGAPEHADTQSICVAALASAPQGNTGVVFDPEVFRMNACCFHKGEVSLGWDVDKTVVSPDSVMEIGMTGSNESQTDVSYLQARLIETVGWTAQGRNESVKRTLAESKLSITNIPQWHSKNKHQWHQEYQSFGGDSLGQVRVTTQLLLPHDARDTYTGSLINVRHALTITAVTQPCITTPESSALVRIQRKTSGAVPSAAYNTAEPTLVEVDVLPHDWQPQEAHVVTLPMSSAVLLDSEYTPPPSSAPDETLLQESRDIATALTELKAAVSSSDDPVFTLERLLNNPMMTATIQNLTPREFVEVLMSASRDLPRLARVLAGVMDTHFQCRHVLACLWALPQPVRLDVMKEVAPLASDLDTQRSMVERELDSNELLHFRAALA